MASIPFHLSHNAEAAGFRLAAFDTFNGSTNTEALDRARAGDCGSLWIVTDNQLGGRGRRNRAWIAPKGNLAASLLIVTDVSTSTAATLGFVAGVALERAIVRVSPYLRHRISLKWPNDILADGAKLSGILLESEPLDERRRAVVVGIGVNVVAAPEGLPYPGASLVSLGANVSASELFAALADEWIAAAAIWDEGRGMGALRDLWLERATGLNGPISVQTPSGVIGGIFETIDDMGRLIMQRADGTTEVVSAGDVHFGGLATRK
ncbi:BirA family biotin operon repressor/biotin-[acetyl-CoA-carboxylase] ligase [Pseudochelatococcus contaminans]|uniref:biotin--[biotin carboxyl-carrier protein] ligase n=1 Tax=Pseudochelatococcus contaminans TaxID=1538103 RepID=A0A7W6EEY0_9HYPH|nr:biotin--[acetyl-CoA-carboxylase] ligase [Pseudochelatococcus contaminans]MBB3808473.1 BirA family biotin operon repressor/biotin-[acetyl-CoA-carboxylase] ligase [Pseudochelatococcus contaminans]